MIVCAYTLRILKNINLADDVIFGSNLYRFFKFEKENKLFIQFGSSLADDNQCLVFDVTNQHFYEKQDLLQFKEEVKYATDIKITVNGDKFCVICTMCENDEKRDHIFDGGSSDSDVGSFDPEDSFSKFKGRVWEEIRIFKIENDVFVETGVKWKSSDRRETTCMFSPWIISNTFVQNLKLN